MKVKITRSTVANGGFVSKGDVIEVSAAEAKKLRLANKAVEYIETKEPAIEAAEPEVDSRVASAPHRKVARPKSKSQKGSKES